MNYEAMFSAVDGWTTQFEIDGKPYGGHLAALTKDPRVIWQLEQIGGASEKNILELGPLEGAHTKMFLDAGAAQVLAIEGNPKCWLRCLIVKEALNLNWARFVLGDFCQFCQEYDGPTFDFVSAAGVLYHQMNPVRLIHNLARITDTVLVWTQVASATQPSRNECTVEGYKGKVNDFGTIALPGYCGGLSPISTWLYPDEMRRCFTDCGFKLTEKPHDPTPSGDCLLFVATK